MKCVACGLDNDPSLQFCDGCEYPLRESAGSPAWMRAAGETERATTPEPEPATAPIGATPAWMRTTTTHQPGDETVPPEPGFEDRLAEPRPLTRPLLAGVAVLLVAAAVGTGIWLAGRDGEPVATPPATTVTTSANEIPTGGLPADPTTATTTQEPSSEVIRAQGEAVDNLLARSKASRDKLTSANGAVFRCAGLSGAVQRLREVGTERASQRSALANLDLSAIPDGEQMRSALDEALDHSLKADRHYVKWAETRNGNGCRNTAAARRHQNLGDQESAAAGDAKIRFLSLWNPVASGMGLPTRDRGGI